MLACVCRPVTGAMPGSIVGGLGAPLGVPIVPAKAPKDPKVVTAEPRSKKVDRSKVPGRLSAGELRAMALRQQQQIDSQHQLLAAKEQRLRFLKAQEARGAAAAKEGERLRRLRERVEAQENKLRRLRALRGQVDLQKTYNVTLSSDLESIRALFSEKEKELSVAVAKVEALTRQLEELRRGRRGAPCREQPPSPAARELDKLRRELMYRNQLSLQQDARLHLQREALQVRQQELRSVDQRILELQGRLHRKRASNMHLQTQSRPPGVYAPPRGNVAAIEPYNHTPQKSTTIAQQVVTQPGLTQHPPGDKLADVDDPKHRQPAVLKHQDSDEFYLAEFSANKSDPKYQTLPYNTKFMVNFVKNKANEVDFDTNNDKNGVSKPHMTVHSTPLNAVNKSVALAINQIEDKNALLGVPAVVHKDKTENTTANKLPNQVRIMPPPQSIKTVTVSTSSVSGGNWKPVSSVAPTSIQPIQSSKINTVTPNPVLPPPKSTSTPELDREKDKSKPALPPKPPKPSPEPDLSESPSPLPTSDNLPIKAKPLTIKKQPMSEQPKLRATNAQPKIHFTTNRRIEMPPAFLFPEIETPDLIGDKNCNVKTPSVNTDEIDRSSNDNQSTDNETVTDHSGNDADSDVVRRSRKGNLREEGSTVKTKLQRRVSFDPLALLLDASLEGELELVKKTATQVTNPSAANDEGITALHNAICAGHLEIVRFLVEFGCDVNAQDSDGWTPLHCAASCNNLSMVRFLVERGACLFAATLSDHETPAEKCEEDEEGFDGCSEYLYSVQEKLGILHTGEVFAVFPYEAAQPDELGFTLGERLTVLRKGDEAEREWWWARGSNGTEGYVPRNLLGLYPRVTPQPQE